ncbi:hypothetical protein P9759_05800 [Heyndrickxia coagulans]|uniref:hypothetical protein n=1 Tax=Heyndrickxia coagulans TaxID=1398 RepID=UPI002E21F7AE|nr:hypothetical protein [Heyndrickxia coagulans]
MKGPLCSLPFQTTGHSKSNKKPPAPSSRPKKGINFDEKASRIYILPVHKKKDNAGSLKQP